MPTRDYNFAVEHIKKYPCWEVWERIMESIDTINTSTSKMLDELNEVIDNRIKKELSTPDITHPLPQILNELVKILKIQIKTVGVVNISLLIHKVSGLRFKQIEFIH